jgi:group I intron endonuclease
MWWRVKITMDTGELNKQISAVLPVNVLTPSRKDYSKPGAYALLHESSGNVYVGSTENLYKRVNQHKTRLNAGEHRNKNLQAVYDEDPRFSLKFTITETKEHAIEIEQTLLDTFAHSGKLLNIATDARLAGKGLRLSEEARGKLRQSTVAQFASPESRQVQSERSKALWQDPDFRSKHVGQKHSEERKLKNSANVTKLWQDPLTRDKMGKHGKQVSIEGVIYDSAAAASKITKMSTSTIHGRIHSTADQCKTYFYTEKLNQEETP